MTIELLEYVEIVEKVKIEENHYNNVVHRRTLVNSKKFTDAENDTIKSTVLKNCPKPCFTRIRKSHVPLREFCNLPK